MDKVEMLLRRIVAAEDAGMQHHEGCPTCRESGGRARCPEGMALAQDGITALLAAKMWVDRNPISECPELRVTGS